MGNLKANWDQTNIPKETKIKLFRIMKDCKTYTDRNAYITKHEELFDEEEHKRCIVYSRDTFSALESEVEQMPFYEVMTLPDDLRDWILDLRPELRKDLKEDAEVKARQAYIEKKLEEHFNAIRELINQWREQLYPQRENVINPILGHFRKDNVKPGQFYCPCSSLH